MGRVGWLAVVAGVACLAAGLLSSAGSPVRADSSSCPWLDPSQPVATRVQELLSAMTPLQEATMLHLLQYSPSVGYEGYTPAIPALCIPIITEQDGPAGVAASEGGVTQLPAPIADAAAFDPSLAERYGDVIGAEDAAKGVDMALAPTINIDRSPRWGRSYESLGEDPYLTASLAVPIVEGIQGNRVVAVVKHFAVYNQETGRGTAEDNAIVSDQALHEIYLPAWRATVEDADPGGIMCSYNLINGTPACQDRELIDTILHGQWNFQGFVRSDCGSVYNEDRAIDVGISQVKCPTFYTDDVYYQPQQLAGMVADGQMLRATLDNLARPLLTVLFEDNLIASPQASDRYATATDQDHDQVARLTADEGTVLLKDDDRLLPLDLGRVTSLALIGPDDGTPMPAGEGSTRVIPTDPVNALGALRAVLGDRVRYDDGSDTASAAQLASQCEVAMVVVNDVESEGSDRPNLELPNGQDQLIEAVTAANPHTIVVLETGSAVLMPWLGQVQAVLETWYPGQLAGTSLVDLVSGDDDPSGKLPVTFPASPTEMPADTPATFGGMDGEVDYSEGVDVGYRWYEADGVTPLFPFGFGLSYTHFAFSDLQTATDGPDVDVRATITNTGSYAGADVVQLYVGDPPSTGEPPRQLRGFQRVQLQPGEHRTVEFTLTPGDLAVWDSAAGSWTVPGGAYLVYVGDGSDLAELPLSAGVAVTPADLGADAGLTPGSPVVTSS
jgi:beta-glucosidase